MVNNNRDDKSKLVTLSNVRLSNCIVVYTDELQRAGETHNILKSVQGRKRILYSQNSTLF